MSDVMIDLETISTKNNAVILTLGAIKFDVFSENIFDGLYIKPNIEEQSELGRHIDDETIKWWSGQNNDVKEEAFGDDGRLSVDEFLNQLTKFCWNQHRIWAKGPMFDIEILEGLYQTKQKHIPWNFRQIRDVRTICDLMPELDVKIDDAHNALSDALNQAKIVQHIYKKLGVKNENNK